MRMLRLFNAMILTGQLALAVEPQRTQEAKFPPAKDFSIETVAIDLSNPMEMALTGQLVFIAELHGKIKVLDLETGRIHVAAHLETDYRKQGPRWSWDVESGVLGIAVDPHFKKNQWVYVFYTEPGGESIVHDHLVSRFRYEKGMLRKDTEQILLRIPALRDQDRIHESGSLAFDPDGNLLISSGDNQLHTRYLYSARTSADSSVLNGKILRIKPKDEGGYTIPAGNLFARGVARARPEIYVMGCRNPFRISVDQQTGYLYWGENGPADYYCGDLKKIEQSLLPLGYDEFNQARKAGFFGWPFFIGPNECYPSYDFHQQVVTGKYDPEQPINDLEENKGVRELPTAQKPFIWYSHPQSSLFPSLGSGGASAIGGPVYYYNQKADGDQALPPAFDHHLFIADYARGWVKVVELDENENMVSIEPFLSQGSFKNPINLKFSDLGELFILQYGNGGWAPNNGGSLVRVRYEIDGGLGGPRVLAARPFRGLDSHHAGTRLLKENHCASCHQSEGVLVGPSWQMIQEKYSHHELPRDSLIAKIRAGGKGVWGNVYEMPPHPHLKTKEVAQMISAIFSLKLIEHAARGKKVHLETLPSSQYFGAGASELVDGICGDETDLHHDWLGFEGADFSALIDLGETTAIQRITLSCGQMVSAGVFLPTELRVEASSDGLHFQEVARVSHDVSQQEARCKKGLSAFFETLDARYLRVKAKNLGVIPSWHQAKGRKAWLFVDEVMINESD